MAAVRQAPKKDSEKVIVRQALWQSLPSLGKFAALGFGIQPRVRPACRCNRCV